MSKTDKDTVGSMVCTGMIVGGLAPISRWTEFRDIATRMKAKGMCTMVLHHDV
jgi:hypothetical protein